MLALGSRHLGLLGLLLLPAVGGAELCGVSELMPPEIHRLSQEGATCPATIADRQLGALLPGSVIELKGPDSPAGAVVTLSEGVQVLGQPSKSVIAYLDLSRPSATHGFYVVPEEFGLDFFIPHDGEARLEGVFKPGPGAGGRKVVLGPGEVTFVVTGTETRRLESRPVVAGGHAYRAYTERTIVFLKPEDENWRGLEPGSLRLVVDLYGAEPRSLVTLEEFFGGANWSPAHSPEAAGSRLFRLRVGILRRTTSGR